MLEGGVKYQKWNNFSPNLLHLIDCNNWKLSIVRPYTMKWFMLTFLAVICSAVTSLELVAITAYDAPTSNSVSEKDVGPKECALGSSYWCQDILSARKCGALKHCIQVVWEYESQPPDSSDICTTCKQMVKEARDELQSNDTQQLYLSRFVMWKELIREVLDGTCQIYFPVKPLANECIRLVNEYIPEFIQMLASRMDPQTVCKTAWLCNSNKFKQIIEDMKLIKLSFPANDACKDCKNFVSDVVAKVKSMPKEEFEKKLLQGCDQLKGYLQMACHEMVSTKFDEMYTYVTTQLDPNGVCALAAMCIDGLEPPNKQLPPVNGVFFRRPTIGDPECDFCEQLVTRLKEQILANATKEEVREVFKRICEDPKSFKDKCDKFVDDYFDLIYSLLTEELDPHEICKALGLCVKVQSQKVGPKKLHIVGDDERNSFEWNPKKDVIQIKDMGKTGVTADKKFPSFKGTADATETATVKNDLSCVLCEFVLHRLQEILYDNRSEAQIKQAVDRVCSLMPQTVSDQCVAFIDEYGSAVMIMLAQELDPSQICTSLELCPGQEKLIPIEESPVNTMARIVKVDTDRALSSQQLPFERMFPFPVNGPKSSETCLLCQYSMSLVHAFLNFNGTKEAILNSLDDVCHDLPSKWTNQCDEYVDNYAEAILTMLQLEDLTQLCGVMSFCQGRVAANLLSSATAASKQAIVEANFDGCEVCERTVEVLSRLLGNPEVEYGIAQALKEACGYVPDPMKHKCSKILEVYGPYLVKMISELADSTLVCQSVDLCPQPTGHVKLIGGEKCTFGPAYWCKNKLHARACKAEEHCKKYVWQK